MTNSRAWVDDGFESLGRILIRYRYAVLVAMAVIIAGLVSQLPTLTSDNSNESFFRPDDPALMAYEAFREQFGREEMIVIAVEPPHVFDRDFMQVLRDFHEALEAEVPYLDEVTSLVNVRHTRGEGDELIVQDLMKDFPKTDAELALLKQRVMDSVYYRDLYISADGRLTAVWVETLSYSPAKTDEDQLGGFDDKVAADGVVPTDRPKLTPEENAEVVAAVEAVVKRFDGPEFKAYVTGTPVIIDFFNRAIQADVGKFMSLSFVAFAIFLALLFRRSRHGSKRLSNHLRPRPP